MLEQLSVLGNTIKSAFGNNDATPPVDKFNASKSSTLETVTNSDILLTSINKPAITINTSIRDKYKGMTDGSWDKRTRKPEDIVELVIHATAGGSSAANLLAWMLGPNGGKGKAERQDEYAKGIALFHKTIDFNGDIIEIIPDENWVYHSSSGLHDATTLGVELMKKSSKNADVPTDAQYKSLWALLLDHWMQKFPNVGRICSHNYNVWKYRGGSRDCPGTFDWSLLDKELTARGYTFKVYRNELRYEIKKKV